MDLQEIEKKLNILLAGSERKIVFWYDDDGSYEEEIDQLQLSGNSKVFKLTESNHFAAKLLLEYQDLTTNYLVYAPFSRPEDKENSLADIFLLFRTLLLGQAHSADGRAEYSAGMSG